MYIIYTLYIIYFLVFTLYIIRIAVSKFKNKNITNDYCQLIKYRFIK